MMDRAPFDDIRNLIAGLEPEDRAAAAGGLDRLHLDTAAGALGALEPVIGWIAGWRGSVVVRRPVIALYAGGHAGAGDAGATRGQLEAIAAGTAPVSRAAQHLGAGLDVFDLAIDRPVSDFRKGAAMSERECAATMAFGMEALAKQPDLLILGALGAGVDRSATALAHGLLGEDAPGDLAEAVVRARGEAAGDPLQLLRQLGGRETAAIGGAIIAAGSQRTPVLLDGLPAIAAAAVLHTVSPEAVAHCRVGQAGQDPVLARMAHHIGLFPLFELRVMLGDGTGSTAALSLIKLACALAPAAKA
ncbi:MAG TPA: nicotinate-nucleotide--dimethylbenzimidazole phosphoribosyltransferase [Caulobacteraceae bacterium]|jgi:nicotinate-nucleotide--dimethylbenzimidazole phosphoribosyltransferase|nr:nicotinate-nucleotide--dimethylbenzimidazole phosphoribosyltransferase [Caulobacteraceae bacterium]